MRTVKITYTNGDHFITRINGNEETIKRYYAIGSTVGIDNKNVIDKVEILN
ncbi:TPA: hypothetical protein QBZ91_002257 [Pasteurella multocida]|uniref:hypothetical protein n=1 Tax=Pasteurella multocida TaxID=747 RepID=UPI0018D21D35|nr:hypothetical protein [Pasteurella multocida]MDY0427511.1 hypothetical protein [Pasteurella multocida]MDY0469853.1 hypothetical protein [Pasteurella multocida]MDY0523168.1 hypothetical protein [Pasteurella multocida]MDY0702070.1 hypothetical protein [Pasteurella multocida]BDE02919.1 hypothetical protein PASm1_08210 [Pasteurella multocida]